MAKVFGSGMKIMSDSSMDLKPLTEEPSKPIPDVKASPVRYSLAGITMSCIKPRISTNAECTHRTLCAFKDSIAFFVVSSMLFTIFTKGLVELLL